MDVDAAVASELASYNKLLPPRWSDVSLTGNEPAVAEWLHALMRREVTVDPEEVVLARKLGRGARPIALLGLKERLLYRGAVSLVEARTGSPDRSQEAYEEFQRAPLDIDNCSHVLKADIASYYQYIDHERLVDEVVAQSGDDLAVTLAVDLLREASSRRFGLPQLNLASDVLADLYIDPVRRDLTRGQFMVWRFADDFRVACRSYAEALAALEATDHAARELGLVLNEFKTSTPSRDHYESSLTAVADRERELFAALDIEELEEPEPGEYSDALDVTESEDRDVLLDEDEFDEGDIALAPEPDDDDPVSQAQLAAASKVLEAWVEEEEDEETQRSERARITAKLLGRAIRVFARGRDTTALEYVPSVLVYEPSLAPTVARYLIRCSVSSRREVRDVLDLVCGRRIVSPWQAIWIAYVAGELSRKRGGADLTHVGWLHEQLRSRSSVLRAEAALALGRRGLVDKDELLEVLTGLPEIHRPTALLALVALGHEDEALAAAGSELDRLRIHWALETLA